ncbi:MAG: hypothetical protein IM638_12820 [Bacteroidetes bacterium]|nr:hypothetical protein [Bacteroidota bacterium]
MENINFNKLKEAIFVEDINLINDILEKITPDEFSFVDEKLNTNALSSAIGTNNPIVVDVILNNGADVNFTKPGFPLPLIEALENAMNTIDYGDSDIENCVNILELLLKSGADIYRKNYNDVTPLEYAQKYYPAALEIFEKYR